ncbi:hypothetical protein [Rhodanobacter thiooxydans]|uniref:hypothetical protein n=1 Tax=Rhodanobacter thiooxydans TaxID=416169 RepID=UPI0012DD886F|nr:hypothetical protein [Rhodanobacter thiooxydans]
MKKPSNPLDEIGATVIGGVLDAARTLIITGPVAILTIGAGLYLFAAHWKLVAAAVVLVLLLAAVLFWYEGPKEKTYREPHSLISVEFRTEGKEHPDPVSKKERRAIDLVGSEVRSNERRARREAETASADHAKKANSRLAPFFYLPVVRPSAGRELFAYTDAWLTLAGLFEGGSIKKNLAFEVARMAAINYHLKLANFGLLGDRGELLSLTDKGVAFFKSRRRVGQKNFAQPGDVKGWIQFFTSGSGPKAA